MNFNKKYLLTTKPSVSFLVSKWKISLLLFLFFTFTFFFPLGSQTFRPVLTIHRVSLLPVHNSRSELLLKFKAIDQILFPDHVLLLTSNNHPSHQLSDFQCIYRITQRQASSSTEQVVAATAVSVLSVDKYNDLESIVRCPSPPTNYSILVSLRGSRGIDQVMEFALSDHSVPSWDWLVYGAVLDGQTVVVFAKGLNLRADRASDASQFNCYFGWGESEASTRYVLTTKAVTAAQEVVRCLLPKSLQKLPAKAHGVRVTLGIPSYTNHHTRFVLEGLSGGARLRLPSVAKLIDLKSGKTDNNKYELCVCTMVWNQAPALREWISYHAWLGVQRWFVYDNNSDDGIEDVINEFEHENFNVSRHVWPWVKTQEAGFSHCALRAKNECKWVGFIDVDEYFYFPISTIHCRPTAELVDPGQNSLRSLVAKYSHNAPTVGEIRTSCHSFGPSGLTKTPQRGVTVGYTCRLQSPERHKSLVRPDALDDTLLTVVHHFHLRPGYKSFNLPQSTAVLNHYKYQVWESFRAKFFRRVATYVADWQEKQNENSKDRAPGLGTKAIEPPNWSHQFCQVWDTGLKDFIMANLADQDSGMLPWERSFT